MPVSVLFNEPKLLKLVCRIAARLVSFRFSALQRAEIAEIYRGDNDIFIGQCFSALQRAEIAEIAFGAGRRRRGKRVSVLFNEPKLLK